MVEPIKHHFIQDRIIQNYKYNYGKLNRVHYYDIEAKKITNHLSSDIMQIERLYEDNNNVDKMHIEKAFNKIIETPFSKILQKKVYNQKEIKITRSELFIIKKYLFIQFLRTQRFNAINMKNAVSGYENLGLNKNEKWLNYLQEALNLQENSIHYNSQGSSLQNLFYLLYKDNYIGFWKCPETVEFVMSDTGFVKEPSSLLTYWIMPISPELAIVLLPTEYKRALENKEFPIRGEKKPLLYPNDLIELGYFDFLNNREKESIAISNIPIIFYTPNEQEYVREDLKNIQYMQNIISNQSFKGDKKDIKVMLDYVNGVIKNDKFDKIVTKIKCERFLNYLREQYDNNINLTYNIDVIDDFEIHCKDDLFLYSVYELDIPTAAYLTGTLMEESYKGFVFRYLDKLAWPLHFYLNVFTKRDCECIDLSSLNEELKNKHPDVFKNIELVVKLAELTTRKL